LKIGNKFIFNINKLDVFKQNLKIKYL